MKFKIKKGDRVQVISGSQKGKSGKVMAVNRDRMQVTIEGLNMRKHHEKAKGTTAGGILSKEGPIHYSNVLLLDKAGKPTRVGIKVEGKGKDMKKVRIAKTTGDAIA